MKSKCASSRAISTYGTDGEEEQGCEVATRNGCASVCAGPSARRLLHYLSAWLDVHSCGSAVQQRSAGGDLSLSSGRLPRRFHTCADVLASAWFSLLNYVASRTPVLSRALPWEGSSVVLDGRGVTASAASNRPGKGTSATTRQVCMQLRRALLLGRLIPITGE